MILNCLRADQCGGYDLLIERRLGGKKDNNSNKKKKKIEKTSEIKKV